MNAESAELLRKILNRTPSQRPSVEEILDDQWLNVRKIFSKDFDELEWEVEYNLARSEALGSIISTVLVCDFKKGNDDAEILFEVKSEDDILEQISSNPDSKLKP